MRDTFIRIMTEYVRADKNIVLITGDLGFGVLESFWRKFPEQFINAGIAEQNMASIAAGLALEGKTVFTYSIGNFPTLRCLEQIRNDIAYHDANVKIVAVGGGFTYGSLGMSHHATEDLAVMRALPNITVFSPGDIVETEEVVKEMMKISGPCYLRIGRGGGKQIHKEPINLKVGKAIQMIKGDKVAILVTGEILSEAKKAAEKLNEEGISTSLYSFPTIKPVDIDIIKEISKTFIYVVTVEEHNIVGGFGSTIAEVMAESRNKKAELVRIGLDDIYSSIVGSQDYLRNYYGMSSNKIVNRILEKVRNC